VIGNTIDTLIPKLEKGRGKGKEKKRTAKPEGKGSMSERGEEEEKTLWKHQGKESYQILPR